MTGITITVGGPPGGGKTTLAKRLAKLLRREHYSAGEMFRKQAAERKMTLAAFGDLASTDSRIDMKLDEDMVALAHPSAILEGRIIGDLLNKRRIPVFRILVTAEESVRAKRIAGRDGQTYEDALKAMRERERVERARYLTYYGIDLATLQGDAQIDSTYLSIDEMLIEAMADLPYAAKTGD